VNGHQNSAVVSLNSARLRPLRPSGGLVVVAANRTQECGAQSTHPFGLTNGSRTWRSDTPRGDLTLAGPPPHPAPVAVKRGGLEGSPPAACLRSSANPTTQVG
jgi:hypothetical protein